VSHISDFLALQIVEPGKEALYAMQTTFSFAHVIGAAGEPERVQSETTIEVPLYDWRNPKEEAEAIIRVMARNAEEFGLVVGSYRAMDRAFWTQVRRNTRALIVHPSLRGVLFLPEISEIFYSEQVPLDRVICVGAPGKSGTSLVREGMRGYILPTQDGVLAVRIAEPHG